MAVGHAEVLLLLPATERSLRSLFSSSYSAPSMFLVCSLLRSRKGMQNENPTFGVFGYRPASSNSN